jgi:uncharacterized glyoxalase superfamily protein PhnB
MARATAITPVLRYRDADAAARWLCEAFGFQEHDRAQELNGHVRYVSLRLGESIVLVRPIAKSVLDDLMVQPEAIGGANTQICYLAVPDVASHHARAEGAAAKIELEPQDDGLGGRFYTCRDLEGHLWSFGTRTYGVAHEAVSAFEPAELSPSLPNTPIASPQPQIARKPAKSNRLLRDIAIATAAAAVVAGGWAYYDTYAGRALRDAAAATSTATAARLEDTVKQLTHESARRLAAEAASAEAAAKLAEERTVAAQLRDAVQRARAELADTRRKKDEAVRALEAGNELSEKHRLEKDRAEAKVTVAKVQIAEAESRLAQLASAEAEAKALLAKEQQINIKDKEELQEARIALLEANKKIEELRVWQLEPMVPDRGDPVAEDAPCVLAVQGKIPSNHKGPNTWTADSLTRLCRGAEASVEPGKCFEAIMRGKVDWGAGTTWVTANALALCGGTQNARRTLDCFKRQVSSSQTWQVAIRQCRAK